MPLARADVQYTQRLVGGPLDQAGEQCQALSAAVFAIDSLNVFADIFGHLPVIPAPLN